MHFYDIHGLFHHTLLVLSSWHNHMHISLGHENMECPHIERCTLIIIKQYKLIITVTLGCIRKWCVKIWIVQDLGFCSSWWWKDMLRGLSVLHCHPLSKAWANEVKLIFFLDKFAIENHKMHALCLQGC
jgi:hypothetical protein